MRQNPLRYRGYVYDTETGFYYLQSRYYDPVKGRFLSPDAFVSTGQGILGNNMFAYCLNNPVSKKDISGSTCADIFDNEFNPADNDKEYGSGRTSDLTGDRGHAGNFTFKSQSVLKEHFDKHNSEFGNAFGSPEEYVDAANYVIQNGEYIANQNAYVKFYGMNGRANYAFVGMSFDHTYITTFHLKHVSLILF